MMIDMHLLTRISGSDHTFRQDVCNKIIVKVEGFIDRLTTDIMAGNYHAAYYRLSDFQSSSSSYCNLNFINFLSQKKFVVKTSSHEDEQLKACEEVILRMNRGVESLLHRFPEDGVRVA